MTDDRVSWCLGQDRCGAYVFTTWRGRPTECTRPVVWAGLVLVEHRHPVELWAEYACDDHRHKLQAPRRLLDRDRDRLHARAVALAEGSAGRPFRKPGPLATGRDARQRLRRALAETPEPDPPMNGA